MHAIRRIRSKFLVIAALSALAVPFAAQAIGTTSAPQSLTVTNTEIRRTR